VNPKTTRKGPKSGKILATREGSVCKPVSEICQKNHETESAASREFTEEQSRALDHIYLDLFEFINLI
jgi:hypothetical protein